MKTTSIRFTIITAAVIAILSITHTANAQYNSNIKNLYLLDQFGSEAKKIEDFKDITITLKDNPTLKLKGKMSITDDLTISVSNAGAPIALTSIATIGSKDDFVKLGGAILSYAGYTIAIPSLLVLGITSLINGNSGSIARAYSATFLGVGAVLIAVGVPLMTITKKYDTSSYDLKVRY